MLTYSSIDRDSAKDWGGYVEKGFIKIYENFKY